MDSTISPRFVTSLLVLLFCLSAWMRAGDAKPPVHMVTEVVGIVLASPRVPTPKLLADPDAGILHLASSGTDNDTIDPTGPMSPDGWQPLQVPAGPAAQRPATVQQASPQRSTGKATARTSTQVARAMPAAKPRAINKARPKPAERPPVLAQNVPPPPEVPALFVPLRRLGLSIQAKLPGAPATVAPAPKPSDSRGSTAV